MATDPYLVLGLSPAADAAAIRQAFRRAAQKWHPDRHGGSVEAHRRFIAIAEAHALLSSPARRAQWDAAPRAPERDSSFKRDAPWTPRGAAAGASVPPAASPLGATPYSPADRATLRVPWPLPRALDGGVVRVSARMAVVCPLCAGDHPSCRLCGGTGQRLRTRTWEVSLPAGTPDGARVLLRGAGHAGPRFSAPGDVELVVHWTKTGGWCWHSDRLEQSVRVSRRALAAGKISLRTPAGRRGTIAVSPDVASGTWLRLPGLGMSRPEGGREDAWVQVIVRD